MQRGGAANKNQSMGYDIPGKDQPIKRSFIERVSEETMRDYLNQRTLDHKRRQR